MRSTLLTYSYHLRLFFSFTRDWLTSFSLSWPGPGHQLSQMLLHTRNTLTIRFTQNARRLSFHKYHQLQFM